MRGIPFQPSPTDAQQQMCKEAMYFSNLICRQIEEANSAAGIGPKKFAFKLGLTS